ncbi:Positive regulator of purine utilization [Ilyonectria robusta]
MADNELEEGEAGQGLNPIACSYCRQRKRKFIDQRSVDEPNSLHHSRQSKADRIKEWDSLPLQSMDEVHKWYQQRIGATPSSAGDLSIDNPPPSTTWPPRAINQMAVPVPITDIPDPEVQQPIVVNTGQSMSASDGDSMLEASWELNHPPSESKAKDLGKKHPHFLLKDSFPARSSRPRRVCHPVDLTRHRIGTGSRRGQ